MNIKYFSVRDKKAEAFLSPFTARTDGEAIRSFQDALQDPKSPFFKYPDDFTLYYVADWNDGIGSFVPAVGGARVVVEGMQFSLNQ